MNRLTSALIACGALAVANFGYQLVTKRKWLVALERTYFGCSGVLVYAVVLNSTE